MERREKAKEKKVKRKRNEPLTRPTVPNPAHNCFPPRGPKSFFPTAHALLCHVGPPSPLLIQSALACHLWLVGPTGRKRPAREIGGLRQQPCAADQQEITRLCSASLRPRPTDRWGLVSRCFTLPDRADSAGETSVAEPEILVFC